MTVGLTDGRGRDPPVYPLYPLRARPAALYGPFPYQMGGVQLKGVELNIPKRIGKRKQWYKVGLDVQEGDLKLSSSLLSYIFGHARGM